MAIADGWNEIEGWLAAHARPMLDSLRPPVAPAALARLVEIVGELPASYVESLHAHDGQAPSASGLIGPWRLMPAVEVVLSYEMQLGLKVDGSFAPELDDIALPDPGIRKVWWHEDWIPVAEDGAGNVVAIDLAPAEGGTHGQLLAWFHDWDGRQLVARDFCEWLELAADAMKRGDVGVEDLGHGIVQLEYRGWSARGPARSQT